MIVVLAELIPSMAISKWFRRGSPTSESDAKRWCAWVLPEFGNDFAGGWGASRRNHFPLFHPSTINGYDNNSWSHGGMTWESKPGEAPEIGRNSLPR